MSSRSRSTPWRSRPLPGSSWAPGATAARSACGMRRTSWSTSRASWDWSGWSRSRRESLALELQRQAEQREQPLGVEEERDLADAARRELDDLQRPRLEPGPLGVRLVLAEGRRAVRRTGGDDPRALASDADAEPPREHVVAALEPEIKGWHRLLRVLADHVRGEAPVISLEPLGIPLEHVALRVVEDPGATAGDRGRLLRP